MGFSGRRKGARGTSPNLKRLDTARGVSYHPALDQPAGPHFPPQNGSSRCRLAGCPLTCQRKTLT